jgi:hypothetical protein
MAGGAKVSKVPIAKEQEITHGTDTHRSETRQARL